VKPDATEPVAAAGSNSVEPGCTPGVKGRAPPSMLASILAIVLSELSYVRKAQVG
jgi:hypothetical protein